MGVLLGVFLIALQLCCYTSGYFILFCWNLSVLPKETHLVSPSLKRRAGLVSGCFGARLPFWARV